MSVGTYPPADTSLTIPLEISNGGTGATTAANARTNLGLGTMATQNANAVAITDGAISIGGHAPTGVLDVQTSVVASDAANNYYGLRVWPVEPAGSVNSNAIRVEAATGAGLSTTQFRAINIADQPITLAQAYGVQSAITAGTGRYNIYAFGTAANYFGGTVQVEGHTAVGANSSLTLGTGNPTLVLGAKLEVTYARATVSAIAIRPSADTGPGNACTFQNASGGVVGSITTTASATAFNTSSDVRLKHNIAKLTDVLSILELLRPIRFNWNADNSEGVGFLAHELQQIIPEAVTGEPDALNDDGTIRPQQADYSKLVPWIIAGMQELAAQLRIKI